MQPTKEPSPPEPKSRVVRVAFGLVREPLYLPVTFAIAAHLALVIAVTVVYHLVRESRYVLVGLLLAELWATVSLGRAEVKDAGTPGPLAAWLAITWVMGGVMHGEPGVDLDRGELTRYLGELAWNPMAIVHNPELRYADGPDGTARVWAHDERSYVDCRFDDAGDLVEIASAARVRGREDPGPRGSVVGRPGRARSVLARTDHRLRLAVSTPLRGEAVPARFARTVSARRHCGTLIT